MILFFLFQAAFALAAHPSQDLSHIIRSKMVEVSLAQTQKMSGHWDEKNRDCAGLIRYVYQKSIGSTGVLWRDARGQEAKYLSAQELYSSNFDYLGHDLSQDRIETGDIMVYQLASNRETIWHLILLLKSSPKGGSPAKALAIYHNGESGKKAKLKRVWAEDFLSPTLGQWSARKENANFVGIFRWKGWSSIDKKNDWKWFEHKVSSQ